MSSNECRAAAREGLRGNWFLSVIVSLVAALLGAGSGVGSNAGVASTSSGGESNAAVQGVTDALEQISPLAVTIMLAILSAAVIYLIIIIIFGGATKLGLVEYNIDIITKRRAPAFSTLFSRYSIFPRAFGLQFMIGLYIFLWALLLIIPGIIAAYRYSMAPYIMAENPEIGVGEAINRSKEMMKGNKMRLFILELSFIGWHILCAFTLGIGFLWLNPYIAAAEAAFYLDISGNINEPEVVREV